MKNLWDDGHLLESEGKLSIKELKEAIGDDSISDALAIEIIDSLYQLSLVVYQVTKNENYVQKKIK